MSSVAEIAQAQQIRLGGSAARPLVHISDARRFLDAAEAAEAIARGFRIEHRDASGAWSVPSEDVAFGDGAPNDTRFALIRELLQVWEDDDAVWVDFLVEPRPSRPELGRMPTPRWLANYFVTVLWIGLAYYLILAFISPRDPDPATGATYLLPRRRRDGYIPLWQAILLWAFIAHFVAFFVGSLALQIKEKLHPSTRRNA
ncbi:hypothetical protein [Phenylobacterium zucineum]|uniref:hypothetical protein n=1 Tax=Phenylobacterium zucineum TaxID=284016 RepID=UPI00059DE66C|nr:hypothetical protein [Phenylobacterium zucineum]